MSKGTTATIETTVEECEKAMKDDVKKMWEVLEVSPKPTVENGTDATFDSVPLADASGELIKELVTEEMYVATIYLTLPKTTEDLLSRLTIVVRTPVTTSDDSAPTERVVVAKKDESSSTYKASVMQYVEAGTEIIVMYTRSSNEPTLITLFLRQVCCFGQGMILIMCFLAYKSVG